MKDPLPKFDTHLINNQEMFERLVDYEKRFGQAYLALDTETDSVEERKANLYGISLALNDKRAFYIPWRTKDGNKTWNPTQETAIKNWLFEVIKKRKVINHNLIYDVLILENQLGIKIDDYIHSDTMLQHHTLDEEPPHGLKEISVRILGDWADKAKQDLYDNIKKNGGKTNKTNVEMHKADTEVLAEYACWDVILVYKLYNIFEEKLIKEGMHDFFYKEEVMPLYTLVVFDMKRHGFPIDVPYYEQLKKELSQEIDKLEDEIIPLIEEDTSEFCSKLLVEEFPLNNKGNLPKAIAEIAGIPMAETKDGKITLAKKAIDQLKKIYPEHLDFYDWLGGSRTLPAKYNSKVLHKARELLFFAQTGNQDKRYVFNLRSNDHLRYLLIQSWGLPILERTEGGDAQIDADYLDVFVKKEGKVGIVVSKLSDYKKLNKLLSTYVEGILERQIDGIIYTSMLLHGTTSGRFSSRNPNLQNQPRIKDEDSGLSPLVLHYVNAIRRGFISGPGRKVVNADYSSLEPVCFAEMSGDQKLKDVFNNGEDLYSRVAIDVFGLKDASSYKKDKNYLKNLHPEARNKSKVFCLAVPYGAEEFRIAEALNISKEAARKIINDYLSAYPKLKDYMKRCDKEAKEKGQVKTIFGRVRHLRQANTMYLLYTDNLLSWQYAKSRGLLKERRQYKNLLNNAKNFPIQGLAANIVNRAMIATARAFKDHHIDGGIRIQVHDEVLCIVREDQAELASKLLQDCMENTTKISIKLTAEPKIAENWADSK